jgi:hypothetical protein
VERQPGQLLDVEEPVVPDRVVARGHTLERAVAQARCEDDVHDVLGRPAGRRDRVGERDRALEREVLVEPHLLGELALEGVDERLPHADAAARQEPVLAALLLMPHEEHPALPPQDRGHPDARLHVRSASSRSP